ncbi:MAG TPA: LysR family transcriptional regulator [Ensifer sp.]|nr:LysR family transcriptional regulator [Ensifer sp.]
MRFKGLDMNLLVALDCLLTEKNVSRAAERLCLSQSATSGALTRLREYFDDELLVQLGRNMVMTPRSAELLPAVRNILLQVEGTIIMRPDFDPTTARRDIRIIASDYMTTVALAPALRLIQPMAPDLNFHIFAPRENPRERLERGEVDFLAMPDLYLSPDHPSVPLFSDTYSAVVWAENDLVQGDTISIEDFLKMRHVAVNFNANGPSFEEWFTQRFGADRAVEVSTSSYSSVPYLIIGTQRIALMHRKMAETFAAVLPLKLLTPPVEVPPIQETLQWHLYNDSDKCLKWVRGQLVQHIAGDEAA